MFEVWRDKRYLVRPKPGFSCIPNIPTITFLKNCGHGFLSYTKYC